MTSHLNQKPPTSRRARRGVQVGAAALLVSAALGAAYHEQVVDADEAPTARAHAPTSRAPDTGCDRLWDRVPTPSLPRAAWESAATGLGLSAQGPWVSADGLSWEHLDGTVVVVAAPRSPSPTVDRQAVCRTDGPTSTEAKHTTEGNQP
jgi:hypothetical protein